jgi:hypothetical protein
MKITRKVGLTIAAASLAVVMVVSVGAVALAQGRNGGAGNGLGTGSCPEAVTELLDLSKEEIQAMRLEGMSLVEIAKSAGVEEADLVEAILAERQAQVQEKLAAGTLTQEQATAMLERMEQNVTRAINRAATGRPEWAGTGASGQGIRSGGTGTCICGSGANGAVGTGMRWGRAGR